MKGPADQGQGVAVEKRFSFFDREDTRGMYFIEVLQTTIRALGSARGAKRMWRRIRDDEVLLQCVPRALHGRTSMNDHPMDVERSIKKTEDGYLAARLG